MQCFEHQCLPVGKRGRSQTLSPVENRFVLPAVDRTGNSCQAIYPQNLQLSLVDDLVGTQRSAAESESFYEVVIEELPPGFKYEGNTILAVNRYSKLKASLKPDSVVVRINGKQVDASTFGDTLLSTALPMKLTLMPPEDERTFTSGSLQGRAQEVSKSLLVDILLTYFSVFVDFFGVLVATPVLPFLSPLMGFGKLELGLLTGIYNLAAVPGALIISAIMSRYGTRIATLFSLGGSAVTLGAQGLVVHIALSSDEPSAPVYFVAFLLVRFVAGLTGSSMPIAFTFIGMRVPSHEKPKYMALTTIGLTLAVMIGPIVGGTLANFQPPYALPFYFGGIVAMFGFLVALGKLGTVRPPQKQSQERMSKPAAAILTLQPLKFLCYGSHIMLGVAFLQWRYNLAADEAGSVTSLHGIIQTCHTVFVVPRIIKRFEVERALIIGVLLMAVGCALAGFMPTWWLFQCCWSLVAGGGFSIINTGASVAVDKYATQQTRPRVHSASSSIDQVSLFAAGLLYGELLELVIASNTAWAFWMVASGVAFLYAALLLLVWLLISIPYYKQNQKDEDAARLAKTASSTHSYDEWQEKEPEPDEADYLEHGRFLLDLMHRRHWQWKSKRYFVERLLEKLFLELPLDTIEHRMEIIWEIEAKLHDAQRSRTEIDSFYDELRQLAGLEAGASPCVRSSVRGLSERIVRNQI